MFGLVFGVLILYNLFKISADSSIGFMLGGVLIEGIILLIPYVIIKKIAQRFELVDNTRL